MLPPSATTAADRQRRPRFSRPRPRIVACLLLATALLPLPSATAALATPLEGVLKGSTAGRARTYPDGYRAANRPDGNQPPARPDGRNRPDDPDRREPPGHSQAPGSPAGTAPAPADASPIDPLDVLGRLIPIGPVLPSSSAGDHAHPARPPAPGRTAPHDSSAGAGPQNGDASRPPSPAASPERPGTASPAPAPSRRGDLAGRLANRPYVPLPPLQAPASSAAPARPHGPSRYAPGAVPGAASATTRTPHTAADQGNGVHRVLPLGAGMALTGLGLGFIALRLRRS
ncbi:hypothetical protein ACH4FX_07865 [Streptomyces sp. NPDC018019]|uniref:hypothetical protein n=1 Tax=Streptomyces sp. NPDC018019 TaxID=3365030 RepID=UPI0037AB1E91